MLVTLPIVLSQSICGKALADKMQETQQKREERLDGKELRIRLQRRIVLEVMPTQVAI
jgi:hypothetical protein